MTEIGSLLLCPLDHPGQPRQFRGRHRIALLERQRHHRDNPSNAARPVLWELKWEPDKLLEHHLHFRLNRESLWQNYCDKAALINL